jgi:hypothetical protein
VRGLVARQRLAADVLSFVRRVEAARRHGQHQHRDGQHQHRDGLQSGRSLGRSLGSSPFGDDGAAGPGEDAVKVLDLLLDCHDANAALLGRAVAAAPVLLPNPHGRGSGSARGGAFGASGNGPTASGLQEARSGSFGLAGWGQRSSSAEDSDTLHDVVWSSESEANNEDFDRSGSRGFRGSQPAAALPSGSSARQPAGTLPDAHATLGSLGSLGSLGRSLPVVLSAATLDAAALWVDNAAWPGGGGVLGLVSPAERGACAGVRNHVNVSNSILILLLLVVVGCCRLL